MMKLNVLLVLSCSAVAGYAQPPTASSPVAAWATSHIDEFETLYRYFHQHPELSFQEEHTAQRFADELRRRGLTVTPSIGGHGVVGVLKNGEGPTLMLRADLDALPVAEETNLAYASTATTVDMDGAKVGLMHACGHDLHMTNLIATAAYLAEHRTDWSGTLVVIGQPAEERGSGAKAMLKDGLFERFPKPDIGLALHMSSEMPAGTVGYRAGYALANVDSVDITVKGRGGHGAYPQTTIDPIVQAAELVMSLQTIVSREVDPAESAVVTVGSIHAGTKHNIISDDCHLQLTVRSYAEEVRDQVLQAIRRKAEGVAMAAGADPPEVSISEGTPALSNDEALVARLVPVFRQVLGDDRVIEAPPVMGGEDFSEFGRAGVPIFMFWLGSVEGRRLERMMQLGETPPSLHSPRFYPDMQPAFVTGVTCMTSAALELLPKKE